MMQVSVAAILVATTALSALLTRQIRRWAAQTLIDIPNARSSHQRPTPRGGGAAIVIAVTVAVVVLGGWFAILDEVWPVLIAGLAVAALGLLDDARPLATLPRLLVHIAIALWTVQMYSAHGILAAALGIPSVVAAAGLVFWIVGLVNAYNFMDGIDGIAGLQAVIAGMAWCLTGMLTGNTSVAVLGAVLAAAAAGFLRYNWPPAHIFMGDVGSTYLGYVFAAIPLLATRTLPHALVLGMLYVGMFVFDTSLTFMRRLAVGEPVFQAHRSHLYQRLAIVRNSHRVATAIVGALAAIVAGTGVATAHSPWLVLLFGGGVFLVAATLLCVMVRRHERLAATRQGGVS